MEQKLKAAWELLNRKRFEVQNDRIYPIMKKMERIERVLFYRYNFYVSYYSPI